MRPLSVTSACALAGLFLAGCVERRLLVRTDPAGARVWVNGVDRGTTPVEVPYVHEGRFEVRVEKPGYQSVSAEVTTPTPADSLPGIDFVMENLYPGTIVHRTDAHYRLEPLPRRPSAEESAYTDEQLAAMLRQAEAFRARAEREIAEPGTPAPSRTR